MLYKILGYENYIKHESENNLEVIIDVETGLPVPITTKIKGKWYKNKKLHKVLKIIHIFTFIALLSWTIIYSIPKISNIMDVFSNSKNVLFLLQYIFGIIYNNNNKCKIKRRYLLVILSMIMSSIAITLLLTENKVRIYHELYHNNKYLIPFLLGIETFISYLIFFTNLATFITVINDIMVIIERFYINFKNMLERSELIPLNGVIEDYSNIKSEHTKHIEELNNIFSSIVFIGIIQIYYILNTPIFIMQIIDSMIFVLIFSIHLFYIAKMNDSIDRIIILINSTKFMHKYSIDYDYNVYDNKGNAKSLKEIINTKILGEKDETDYNVKIMEKLQYDIYVKSFENGNYNQWLMLHSKINSEWKQFEIFGYDIDGITPVKKALGILFILFLSTDSFNELTN